MKNDVEQGMLVRIIRGHDADRLGIVIKTDDAYIWYCDGKYRGRENPKRKNRRHVVIIGTVPTAEYNQLLQIKDSGAANAAIRKLVKETIQEVEYGKRRYD